MPKKLTFINVKNYIEERGYVLIDDTYINNFTKLTFRDIDGYYYYQRYNDFHKSKPLKFDTHNPYTIQNIKLWCQLNKKPFELISDKYNGTKPPLKWKCLKEDCGEIFETSLDGIINRNYGCQYCNGNQVGISNCLATLNPDIAKEWHPTKNKLTPFDVTCGSNKKVWWICKDGHEWEATIKNRNIGHGCLYCTKQLPTQEENLAVLNPELCRDWNYQKNKKLPDEYRANSGKKVYWKCHICNEEWEATISSRNNIAGCPFCSGYYPSKSNNLFVSNSKLCEEWDYEKNSDIPENFTPNTPKKVWWKCKECGGSWIASIQNRNSNMSACPECSKSKGEKRCKEYFDLRNTYYIPQKEFEGLLGLGGGLLSYDFYLPQYNLLVEYQGEFHDGTAYQQSKEDYIRQQEHDKRKKQFAENNNIKLLEIWYWDFDNIETILNKYISNLKETA